MSDIATHMRITGLQVTNEDVDSRSAAAVALKTAWGKIRSTQSIIGKAADVAASLAGDGVPSVALGTEVQTVIQKHASAFLFTERPFDVGIVAANAVIGLLAEEPGPTGWATTDVWAAALWSALGFQRPLDDPKREALRTHVLEIAKARSTAGGEAARQRIAIHDFKKIEIVAGEEEKFPQAFETATSSTIDALRRNAALDREELDFLWWTLRGRSRLLSKPFSRADCTISAIAAGIEAASQLRRLPCDVHQELVLVKVAENPELNLVELVAKTGGDRELLGGAFIEGFVAEHPTVFPLLWALATGQTDSEASAVTRPVEDWAARALLEAALEKMLKSGPAKL